MKFLFSFFVLCAVLLFMTLPAYAHNETGRTILPDKVFEISGNVYLDLFTVCTVPPMVATANMPGHLKLYKANLMNSTDIGITRIVISPLKKGGFQNVEIVRLTKFKASKKWVRRNTKHLSLLPA